MYGGMQVVSAIGRDVFNIHTWARGLRKVSIIVGESFDRWTGIACGWILNVTL